MLAEIIAITLGTVQGSPFITQLTVLTAIAVAMTVGVYGLVASIVKLDDGGLYLSQRSGDGAGAGFQRSVGRGILLAAPWLMKGLSIAGTIAMFLVGGGILTHGFPPLQRLIDTIASLALDTNGIVGAVAPVLLDGLTGLVAGVLVFVVVTLAQRTLRKSGKPADPFTGSQ